MNLYKYNGIGDFCALLSQGLCNFCDVLQHFRARMTRFCMQFCTGFNQKNNDRNAPNLMQTIYLPILIPIPFFARHSALVLTQNEHDNDNENKI